MGHGSAGIYLSDFPDRLFDTDKTNKEFDNRIEKGEKKEKRKEFIDQVKQKIINFFRKENKSE